MWTCPYCGSPEGMVIRDAQFAGVLCLEPDCGRVHPLEEQNREDSPDLSQESDL